jgi:putative spermidine/putrescine transport system ATP-binding protein
MTSLTSVGIAAMPLADAGEATMQPMVRVEGVSKRFGAAVAVSDVSFRVDPGRFLTILGPSGSGKTTLLRMIAGFIEPSSGEIFIHGKPVSAAPPHKRSIGMVFQRLALFPHLSAFDNVAYPLRMRRFDAREIPDRVASIFRIVQLAGLERRRIHELSGGQQQRVAIARALVFEPDLVLLDEPLAALDRKLREEMQVEFRRIQQELGVTTINVTHDQREALVMSDEVLVIDHGRMQQLAPPGEAYRRPANAFVAGFIGVTNFMTGTAVGAAPLRVRFGELESEARIAHPGDGAPAVGTTIDCALRAEHLRIGPGPLHDVDVACAGTVRHVLFEGDRVVYEVDAPALGVSLVRAIDRSPDTHLLLRAGQAVTIGWRARDLLAFPR